MRGEKEYDPINNRYKRWKLDKFSIGGVLTRRGTAGIDFKVQNQRTGVIIKIELKQSTQIKLTSAQFERFRFSLDTPKSVTRLCFIQQLASDPECAVKVLYLSPKFFQSLPQELFKLNYGNPNVVGLKWKEIEGYLEQNGENVLCNVIKGEFGSSGAWYKPILLEDAYDWIYLKLCKTLDEPLEELQKDYRYCPVSQPTSKKIKILILETLENSYRPIFVVEFVEIIKNRIPDLVSKIGGKMYIMGQVGYRYLGGLIKHFIKSDKRIIRIKTRERKTCGCGLKEYYNYYIPLPLSANRFLDQLKMFWVKSNKDEFVLSEISEKTNYNVKLLRDLFSKNYQILRSKGLIEIFQGRPVRIKLTDKCMKYFSWNSF